MKRYRTLLVIAALGLLASSCEPAELTGSLREGVSFAVTVEEGVATKAAPGVIPCTSGNDAGTESELFLTMEEAPFPASFSSGPATKKADMRRTFANYPVLGLVAYSNSESGAAPSDGDGWVVETKIGGQTPGLIPLEQDTPASGGLRPGVGSGKWIPYSEDRLLWPGEGYIRYFCVAPYDYVKSVQVPDGIVDLSVSNGTAPVITYEVPSPLPKNQVDILVSKPVSTQQYNGDPGWRKIDVPMGMVHALTGIRFRLPEGLAIDQLMIENVYGKGTLDLTSSPLAWSQTGSAAALFGLGGLSLGAGLEADTHETGYNITDADNIFYL